MRWDTIKWAEAGDCMKRRRGYEVGYNKEGRGLRVRIEKK